MTILDACAVLALLKDEPAADEVEELANENGRLTALGVGEVLDHLVRLVGVAEDEAVLDLAGLGLLLPVPVDGTLAIGSSLLRAAHYHRTRRPVSLADCVAAAAARQATDSLATADPHLLALCHDEGIPLHPLPNSKGDVWSPS
jgi:predicted nucleic acid-binding protein